MPISCPALYTESLICGLKAASNVAPCAAGMIYAGGPKFLLLSAILYAPGTLLFFLAKRERKEPVFEAALFAALAIAACAGVYALAVVAISI